MKKGPLVLIGIAVVIGVLALSWFLWVNGAKKAEISLSNRFDAQFNVVETTLDTMRITIMNTMKCTREHADKVVAVVAEQTKGRQGGALFKSTAESEALGLTPEMYLKVANAIEGQLAAFKSSQDVLTDVWRQHKTYCEDPFHNMLGLSLISKVKPKPEMISSGATKEAMKTKVFEGDLISE